MQLLSPAFKNNQPIPAKYANNVISPPLLIQNTPSQTRSLSIVVHDPDAPGMDFVHWLIWNITPDTKELLQGQIPQNAIQGINDASTVGWTSPAPPTGTHRYFFELYALDTILNLPQGASINALHKAIDNHVIEKSELIGTYSA